MAQRHAFEGFTRRDYVLTHTAGVISSLVSAGLVSLYPNRWTVFVFFAFVFAPTVLLNIFFHAGDCGLWRLLSWSAYSIGLLLAALLLPESPGFS
jgi:hypothetical protein